MTNKISSDEPIVVGGYVLPTALAVGLRLLIITVLPFLVSKGIIPEGSTESVVTYGIVIATVAYGFWKTIKTKKDQIVIAEAAPNSVSIVKK